MHPQHKLRRGAAAWALAILALTLMLPPLPAGAGTARAEGRPGPESPYRAGEFDHYLLALSWVPGLCAAGVLRRDDPRCQPAQPRGTGAQWMVHGLWPQYAAGGWPEYCRSPHRPPSRAETARQAALFGTSGAAWHQWNKHGSCTGLTAQDYYARTRAAFAAIALPDAAALAELSAPSGRLAPAALEDAVAALNPGLNRAMMVSSCRRGFYLELRLCLDHDLEPRPCDRALQQRACTSQRLRLVPPH